MQCCFDTASNFGYFVQVRSAYESALTEVCSPGKGNVGLLAYSPLAGGSLSGKYAAGNVNKDARFNLFPGVH